MVLLEEEVAIPQRKEVPYIGIARAGSINDNRFMVMTLDSEKTTFYSL